MKVSKKLIMIIVAVLVLLIGGGIAVATNTPTARAERQLNLGNKYLEEGKYQEAILAFNKAIEIEPKNIPARLGLGKAYIATNDFDNAEKVLKEVLDIDPGNIQAREDLFQVYLKKGNADRANEILQDIVKSDPQKNVDQLKANLVFVNAIHGVVYTPESVQDAIKAEKAFKNGAVHVACYLDVSKNIAYYGKFRREQISDTITNIVGRVYNPNIIPVNEVPKDDPLYLSIIDATKKHNTTKVLKFDNGYMYLPVIIEGNDFEGDLKRAGLNPESYVFEDYP